MSAQSQDYIFQLDDFAKWCRRVADECPYSRAFYLRLAHETEAKAKRERPRVAA